MSEAIIPIRRWLKMVLVTRYTHLRKRDPPKPFKPFTPLRAVGLSVELGWKLARDRGLGAVTSAALGKVLVAGDLRVQGVVATQCDLQLRAEDAELAKTLLRKQRALLTDLGFNVWAVDFWQPGCSKRLDLVGDFGLKNNFGIQGRVWVELKVVWEGQFAKTVREQKTVLAEGLATESVRDPTLQGVLLLAAKVPRVSGGRWGAPSLHAMLLARGSGVWLDVAGGRKAARGQVTGAKPPLAKVWPEMEWHLTDNGQRVGLLKHFLGALRLPLKNAGQRAGTLNGLLRQSGKTGRLVEKKLQSKTGRKPWVASKDTFRDIYQCL